MTVSATKPLLAEIRKAARQLANGRRANAVLIYDEVAAQAGDDIALNIELGHLCSALGARDQAATHYSVAVDQEPGNAHFLGFLGVACQQSGRSEEAFELFQRAIAIDDRNSSVLNGLAIFYMAGADYLEARKYLDRAQELKPSDPNVRTNLATTLAHLNEHESALKHAEKAMQLDPSNPIAHYALGSILTELGRSEDAVRHFEKTIRQHPTFGAAYDLLAKMKKFSPDDRSFIDKTEKVLRKGMPARERSCVHYALGKMYDDCCEFDSAFEHYRQANLLQKKPYDTKSEKRLFKQVKKAFDAPSIQRYQAFGHTSDRPVFIVGMPRSGTTLMEQMIASHSRAAAAEELPEIPRIARLISPTDDLRSVVAKTHANLTGENLQQHAQSYLKVLQQGRDGADRIVDKLPGNFLNLGLVATLFPNATIIHAIRNPLDTCLSCYFQNFTNVRWANDFDVIADVYLFYRRVMAHWHSVLPDGRIIDVHYEQLIEDPEAHGRRMIEGCGLSWEADSLEFQKRDAVVKTASLWQVRQPIYRTSRMRWANYATYVGGLAAALSNFLQDDRELLAEHGVELTATSTRGWLRRMFG